MQKLKKFFNFSLAEIITVIAEILIIGVLQMIMGYGEMVFLLLIYVIARLHPLSRKLVGKLLTKI